MNDKVAHTAMGALSVTSGFLLGSVPDLIADGLGGVFATTSLLMFA
jgi:hypothetical protein